MQDLFFVDQTSSEKSLSKIESCENPLIEYDFASSSS